MNTKLSNLQYAINADPSNKYLLKQFKKQEHLIFITYQGNIEGVIKEIHQYTIKLKNREDDLNKHDILYFCKPEAINAIDNVIQIDK